MSSQGPASGSRSVSVGSSGCFGPTGTSQVPVGPLFNTLSIGDSSDWIARKKKLLVLNENKSRPFQDPWFAHGNNYRLDYLGGLFQNGTPPSCTGCNPSAYTSSGPF